MTQSVPDIVVRRLPVYLQALLHIAETGQSTISSRELGKRLGASPAQIRKDLSYFGEFGRPGLGYDVGYLIRTLERILQLDQDWQVIIVGAGALGHALANYPGFGANRFHIVAVFDNDPARIGTTIGDLVIRSVDQLAQVACESRIDIAILAVPARAAQAVTDQVIACNVRAILNYAPITLTTPPGVHVTYIDPIARLQTMTYYL
ncbi:MAG: redox-sensing transcriptional repressor Rex [Anaerolineae bacterium]|jgi:redox-sensing transcriptional repressor|nr:redox-sensing transcriptional repressor Rex [Chloroflexota bacterium]